MLMLLLLLLLPKRQAYGTGEAHQIHIELDRLICSKFILLFELVTLRPVLRHLRTCPAAHSRSSCCQFLQAFVLPLGLNLSVWRLSALASAALHHNVH